MVHGDRSPAVNVACGERRKTALAVHEDREMVVAKLVGIVALLGLPVLGQRVWEVGHVGKGNDKTGDEAWFVSASVEKIERSAGSFLGSRLWW